VPRSSLEVDRTRIEAVDRPAPRLRYRLRAHPVLEQRFRHGTAHVESLRRWRHDRPSRDSHEYEREDPHAGRHMNGMWAGYEEVKGRECRQALVARLIEEESDTSRVDAFAKVKRLLRHLEHQEDHPERDRAGQKPETARALAGAQCVHAAGQEQLLTSKTPALMDPKVFVREPNRKASGSCA
jgi:hypothetical protein